MDNFTSISAAIDDEFGCPLDTVPLNLQLLVAEKMPYKDFATFSRCSKSSAAVCDKYPADVGLHLEMDTVRFNWRLRFKLPPYLRLTCNVLYITSYCDLKLIERHVWMVDQLHIDSPEEANGFIQQALKLIKPRSLNAYNCTKDTLLIPEVQELSALDVTMKRIEASDDFAAFFDEIGSAILGLKASFLRIREGFLSADRLFMFIQQWISGSREIESASFSTTEKHFPYSFQQFLALLDADKFARNPARRDSSICVCRSNAHMDCIRVELTESGALKIDRIEGECPVELWKQSVSSVLCRIH